ncbi:type II toxin-antitoxin system Rv0910 family toxin [Williamsia sp.]|uniref:type II toxin-antitoxin system Rv0910 family toxin n=1 Tax=Williamsia sp. TaxID=1872085 RepID=UPI002F92E791
MAKVKDSIEIGVAPDKTWEHVLDLASYDEWLTIHEAWRSPLPGPDEVGKGTKVSSIIASRGTRVRFEWTVNAYDPPHRVSLKGTGKGGIKVTLILTVDPAAEGSKLTFEIELGGLALIGPIGKITAKVVKSEVEDSLKKFHDLYS